VNFSQTTRLQLVIYCSEDKTREKKYEEFVCGIDHHHFPWWKRRKNNRILPLDLKRKGGKKEKIM
jgi:hypothetical protein